MTEDGRPDAEALLRQIMKNGESGARKGRLKVYGEYRRARRRAACGLRTVAYLD